MKHLVLITGFISLFICGCIKQNDTTIKGDGVAYADFNGVRGEYAPFASHDKYFPNKLNFAFTREINIDISEDFNFMRINKTLEKQILVSDDITDSLTFAAFYTSSDNQHSVCDNYLLILSDTVNNWLQITEEYNNFKELKGSFSATFIKVRNCSFSYPDTVKIRNGTFHITNVSP